MFGIVKDKDGDRLINIGNLHFGEEVEPIVSNSDAFGRIAIGNASVAYYTDELGKRMSAIASNYFELKANDLSTYDLTLEARATIRLLIVELVKMDEVLNEVENFEGGK